MNYYIYLIFAFLCFTGEIFTLDFSLACFGVGFIGAAVAAYFGLGLGWQVAIFAVVSLLMFLGMRPVAKQYLFRKNKHFKSNVDALVGKRVQIETAIDPESKIGRAKIDGDSWRVYSQDQIPVGEFGVVDKVDGATLFIRKENN